MMKRVITICAAVCAASLFAKVDHIAIDEEGNLIPAKAATAIGSAVTASARIDLAEAKMEIISETARQITEAIETIDDVLKHRTDYSLVYLTATGLEDAITSGGEGADPYVRFIEDLQSGISVVIDHESSPVYNLVTLYYEMGGNLATPKIVAKSAINGEWLRDIDQTAPEQISWGEEVYYKVTVSVPKSWGASAFFQITAEVRTAVDDGKVFDVFSDTGVTGTFTVHPTETVTFRLVAGRVVNLRKGE